jgi:hypothetical protein
MPAMQLPSRREVLTLFAALAASGPTLAQVTRANEQEAIATFFNSVAGEVSTGKSFVFAPSTATANEVFIGDDSRFQRLKKELPEASDAVIADFLKLLDSPSPLELPHRLFRKEIKWSIAKESDLKQVFSSNSISEGWKTFYRKYPTATGLTRLSRVGLDDESKQALFFFSMTPEGLGGSGHFVLMHRRFGVWRQLSTSVAWVS